MTNLRSMTPSEFTAELTSAIFDYFDGRGSERYHKARRENDRRLYREEAMTKEAEWIVANGQTVDKALWAAGSILSAAYEADGKDEK